jgi:hypothetical protein
MPPCSRYTKRALRYSNAQRAKSLSSASARTSRCPQESAIQKNKRQFVVLQKERRASMCLVWASVRAVRVRPCRRAQSTTQRSSLRSQNSSNAEGVMEVSAVASSERRCSVRWRRTASVGVPVFSWSSASYSHADFSLFHDRGRGNTPYAAEPPPAQSSRPPRKTLRQRRYCHPGSWQQS